jgi:hypothetical protein
MDTKPGTMRRLMSFRWHGFCSTFAGAVPPHTNKQFSET